MFYQIGGSSGKRLLKRSQPYRNERIINVIRDMYFTGGVSSFAMRFDRFFPRYRDSQGVVRIEVPEAMVALVATAVRYFVYHASVSMLTRDLAVLCHFRLANRGKDCL